MIYTIQPTQGIKTKMYSIFKDGVEWVRSLSLVKAKKIVEDLTSTTKLTKLEEQDEETAPYEYLNRSADVFSPNRSPSERLESSSVLYEEKSTAVSVGHEQFDQSVENDHGGSLCNSHRTDGAVHQESKLDEFQRMVQGIAGTYERHHELVLEQGQLVREQGQLVREQGQLVREQGQLVREQGQLVREQGQLVQRVALIAQVAIEGGLELCDRLEAHEGGSQLSYRQNLQLEMSTINVSAVPAS